MANAPRTLSLADLLRTPVTLGVVLALEVASLGVAGLVVAAAWWAAR